MRLREILLVPENTAEPEKTAQQYKKAEMARETGPGARKGPVLVQSEYQLSSSRSEGHGIAMWKEQNCNCGLAKNDVLGSQCYSQCWSNNARQPMNQSYLPELKDCSIASEDCAISHAYRQQVGSRKSKLGSHRHSKRTLTHHHHQQQHNWSSNHFRRLVVLSVAFLLLVFSTPSLAHDLPWDTWTIEDTSTTPGSLSPQGYYGSAGAVTVPDLVAIAGRLFEYQISTGLFRDHRSSLHFQAREAGRNKLPNWLSFNSTTGTFSGVPLNEDKGKLYITLDMYITKGGGSVVVSETLFPLKVVEQKAFSSLTPIQAQPIVLNETNCLENFYLSHEPVPSYPTCPPNSNPPLIVTLLTYPRMKKLSGAARASLVVSLSEALGVCPSSLVVDRVGWSSIERMKLWSQLAEVGITEYLDSTSAVSLTLCGINDPISHPIVDSILQKLNGFITNQLETEFETVLWFLSVGANVLEKSAVSTDVHTRLRRQVVDLEELPTIEITTASPELVSSSSSSSPTPIPSSRQQTGSSSTTSRAVDGRVSTFSTLSMTVTNTFTAGNMPTPRATYSTTTFGSFHTANMPGPTSPSFDAPMATSVRSPGFDAPMATSVRSPGFDAPMATSVPSPGFDAPMATSVPSPGFDTMSVSLRPTNTHSPSFDVTSFPNNGSTPTSSSMADLQRSTSPLLPSSRSLSNPITTSSGLALQASFDSGAIQPTSTLIAPSSRVVPSSEPTLILTPSSPPPPTIQPSLPSRQPSSSSESLTSSERGPEIALTSIPVMSLMFSTESLLTSLPVFTESVSPTASATSSRLFTIQSSIDDLRSPTPTLSTFSLPPSSLPSSTLTLQTSSLPLVSSSEMVLLPETSTPLPSPSPSFSQTPTTTQLLATSSLAPVISSDILLPETPTLSTPLITESPFAPTISSDIVTTALLPTSIEQSITTEVSSTVFMLLPTTTMPDITSDLLMPETSLMLPATSEFPLTSSSEVPLPTIETTPSSEIPFSSSSEVVLLPSIEPTPSFSASSPIPESTVFSSPGVVLSSSNNLLMPMSSSELTLSISVFTPSPVPTLSLSSIDIFPDPSSTLAITTAFTTSMVDTFTSSSMVVIFPEQTSSVLLLSPTTSSIIASSSTVLVSPTSTSIIATVLVSPTSTSIIASSSTVLVSPTSTSIIASSSTVLVSPTSTSIIASSSTVLVSPTSTSIIASSSTVLVSPTTSSIIASSSTVLVSPTTSSIIASSSAVLVSPTTSSIIASSDFITSPTPLPSSSEEIIFPEPTTVFIPPSPSLATSALPLPTPFTASAFSSFDVFPPSSSVLFQTETIVIFPETTRLEPPPTTLQFTETPAISSSPILDLIETTVLQTTQVPPTTTAIPSLRTTPSPSSSPSPPPYLTTSPPASPSSPFTSSPPLSFTPSPSPSPTPSPSPSPTPSPSPSLTPSPSPSPSPQPPLSFCEQNNIDCGKGICLADDDIDITSLTFCQCFPDYTGTFCNDVIDNCSPSLCFEDGTRLCIDGNATFTCICREEYTGELCDELLLPCLSSPCHSLAMCVELGVGGFECLCPLGYTGDLCNENIDPCDPNPCGTNETCVIVDSQNFTCRKISVSSLVIATSTTVESSSTSSISPSTTVVSSLVVTPSSSSADTTSSFGISLTVSSTPVQSSVEVTPSPTLTPSPPVSNESPMLLNPIGTLITNRGQIFRFLIPEDTFYDPESGPTSSLSLTLLNYRGDPLANTTWIQVNEGNIEGLPLSSEITNEAITEHLFILQAQDNVGSSAHDFVTVRVLPLGPFSSLFTVIFENEFEVLSQNLTHKINLVQRLSSSAISPGILRKRQLELSPQNYNPEEIFIREIFDTSPLAVSYKNLTIPDLNCAEFYDWIQTIYNFTSNDYTLRFLQAMQPDFIPTPTPTIEGICRLTTSNIPPTLAEEVEINISDTDISHRNILLATLVPAAALSLCCLLLGLCALCLYRRRRSERKYCTSKRLYLNRRPIFLEGEADFPERRGRPVILENDFALQGDSDEEEELSHVSSDLSIIPPVEGERERLVRHPSVSPPNYRLPPLYTHGQFYDFSHDR